MSNAPIDEHDALPAGTRFGELEVLRVLGIGGFGIVYLAFDHALEREVALKEYMPASLASRGQGSQITVRSAAYAETYAIGLRSFVNEARMLARFDHPSMVKVYRFWEDNGTAYMVMPYLLGTTLRDMRRAMTIPPDEPWIRSVLDPVLSAVELLHKEGVYHRDIAPDNILLPPEAAPILLDFGAARRVISDRTQSLTAILKPSYAPIEQYAEMVSLRQGPWTDIYAIGAVIHFLLFGAPPSPATARAVHDDLAGLAGRPPPEGVSLRMMQALAWSLAIKPTERPQSIAELRAALDGRAAAPVAAAPPMPPADPDATIIRPRTAVDAPTQRMPSTYAQPTQRLPGAYAEPTQHVPRGAPTVGAMHVAPSEPPRPTMRVPPSEPPRPRPGAAGPAASSLPTATAGDGSAGKIAAGVGVLVLLVAAGAWWVMGRSPAPPDPGTPTTSTPAPQPTAVPAPTTTAAPPPAATPAPTPPAPATAATPAPAPPAAPPAAAPPVAPPVAATPVPAPTTVAAPAPRPAAAPAPARAPATETAAPRRRTEPETGALLPRSPNGTRTETEPARPATDPPPGRPTAAAPPPAEPTATPVPSGPRTAREACGSRVLIALFLCLDRECAKPQFSGGPDCRAHADEKRLRDLGRGVQ